MRTPARSIFSFLFVFLFSALFSALHAQSNSGVVSGVVTDPSGAIVPGATVSIQNPVSQYSRTTTTDKAGHFQFPNLPFNPYHLTVVMTGFGSFVQDVDVTSVIAVNLTVPLKVSTATSTVTVEGGEDLIENDPTFHTDVDRGLFGKLPLESQSSSLSSLVTLTSPGCRGGFERPLPRAGRSRLKFLFRGRAAHHGSAEQGIFQPAANELCPVA
jgi:hypothetical protein